MLQSTQAAVKGLSPALNTTLRATMLLTRQPIVTPDLTPMESAYYNYQEELNRRLMWTFPYYYYFKKGSLSERRFFKAQRGPVSKQPGVFYAKGVPDIVHNRDRRSKQEVIIPKEDYDESSMSDISRPVVTNSRVTEADKKGDVKSLERQLSRTLHLLIKEKGVWKLPSFENKEMKPLHQVAEAGIRQVGGDVINTWTVARSPCAVLKQGDAREFVIKSHILSGAFNPKGIEYAWLTREEIKEKCEEEYFKSTEHLYSLV